MGLNEYKKICIVEDQIHSIYNLIERLLIHNINELRLIRYKIITLCIKSDKEEWLKKKEELNDWFNSQKGELSKDLSDAINKNINENYRLKFQKEKIILSNTELSVELIEYSHNPYKEEYKYIVDKILTICGKNASVLVDLCLLNANEIDPKELEFNRKILSHYLYEEMILKENQNKFFAYTNFNDYRLGNGLMFVDQWEKICKNQIDNHGHNLKIYPRLELTGSLAFTPEIVDNAYNAAGVESDD